MVISNTKTKLWEALKRRPQTWVHLHKHSNICAQSVHAHSKGRSLSADWWLKWSLLFCQEPALRFVSELITCLIRWRWFFARDQPDSASRHPVQGRPGIFHSYSKLLRRISHHAIQVTCRCPQAIKTSSFQNLSVERKLTNGLGVQTNLYVSARLEFTSR